MQKSGIFRWVIFTSLGYIAGFILAMAIANPLGYFHLGTFGLGIGIAAGIGFFQWLCIRKKESIPLKFVLYAILGMGCGFLLVDILHQFFLWHQMQLIKNDVFYLIMLPFGAGLGSAIAGHLQYKYIFRKEYSNARAWKRYNSLGWIIANLLIAVYFYAVAMLHLMRSPLLLLSNFLVIFSVGPVLGIITGYGIQRTIQTKPSLTVTASSNN